jgi:hypothetical protein
VIVPGCGYGRKFVELVGAYPTVMAQVTQVMRSKSQATWGEWYSTVERNERSDRMNQARVNGSFLFSSQKSGFRKGNSGRQRHSNSVNRQKICGESPTN